MSTDRPSPSPEALREGVRQGVIAALGQSGTHAARRLLAAGAAGVLGSVGAVLILAGHPYGHHPSWHLATFSCLWGALLVVAFALIWLRIRTPDWPLAEGARTGVVALGLVGVAALFSPDPHVLQAWLSSGVGGEVANLAGLFASTATLGVAMGAPAGLLSAAITIRPLRRRDLRLAVLATGMVTILLVPGLALQCVGTSAQCFYGWLIGIVLGAGSGIAVALLPWRGLRGDSA